MRLLVSMLDVLPRRGVNRWTAIGLMALLVLAVCGDARAQFGLAEQAAVNDIQNEVANGPSNRNRNEPAEEDPEPEAPEAEDADESGEDEPAAAGMSRDEWNDEHSIFRQDKMSISWWKALLGVLFFLIWVRSADWVNRDSQLFDLGHETWNAVMVVPFLIAAIVALLIPNFVIGIVLLALAWLVPFIIYAVHHNKSVEQHQTVFTPSWFRFQLAEFGQRLGMKVSTEQKADYMRGPQVDLEAKGGDDRTNQANLLTARQSPGYVHVKELVADMVARGSSKALLDYGTEVVNIRHMIDGVWHAGDPRDRESGDVTLAVMKQLAGLEVSERKKKQEGEFAAGYEKHKYTCLVSSQGVKTGERVVVSLRGGKVKGDFHLLEELGMRSKLREQWAEVMGIDEGVIIYSAMPEGGLSTLTDVGLLETDRLLRDFVAVEDSEDPESYIENVPPHFYNSAEGQSPSELIPTLSRKYPNVWVVRDFVDAETAKLMMDEVDLERVVVTTVHAKEAAEACLRLLKKKTPHKELAKSLVAVINTRLIRTLCSDCKVEYDADPRLLKKLGIPSGKVTKFYQPPKPEEIDKPCKTCRGIGFKGRTGLFELLIVDDQFREKLLKEPKLDVLRKAARAAGMRTLQEEGILLVAKGTTSLSELSRILKD